MIGKSITPLLSRLLGEKWSPTQRHTDLTALSPLPRRTTKVSSTNLERMVRSLSTQILRQPFQGQESQPRWGTWRIRKIISSLKDSLKSTLMNLSSRVLPAWTTMSSSPSEFNQTNTILTSLASQRTRLILVSTPFLNILKCSSTGWTDWAPPLAEFDWF